MKYTILGFQQNKANKLKLNMNDLLLMRTIKDMYSSASMEYIVDNGDKYMWANQNYLHRQIPIIGSKRTMIRIMDKLVDLGLLDKVLKHSKGGVRGNFSYIRPTIKMDSLQDYDPHDKVSQGLRQDDTRVMTKRHDKDASIRDTSIRDNSNSPAKAERIPCKEIIDYLNEQTGRRYSHKATKNQDLIKARWNEGFRLDDFIQVVDNKVNDWLRDEKMNQYLRPATLFSNKFDGYLNETNKRKVTSGNDWESYIE